MAEWERLSATNPMQQSQILFPLLSFEALTLNPTPINIQSSNQFPRPIGIQRPFNVRSSEIPEPSNIQDSNIIVSSQVPGSSKKATKTKIKKPKKNLLFA